MKRMMRLTVAVVMLSGLIHGTSMAGEVTLRAVSAFTENTAFSISFERFMKKVNAEGKGLVQINFMGGGGKVMSPFEVGNAVKTGVVDIANVAGAFYTNLMPEADALKLCQVSPLELTANGGRDLVNKLHNEKLNSHFLAWYGYDLPFHLYLSKPIEKPEIKGFKIRVTPAYRAFFETLGASAMRTPPGEIYTALERGVVDGFGWPIIGLFDLGLQEVTKYRVDPGFYNVDVNVLVNLNAWNKKLNDEQRAFLTKMGVWLETINDENQAVSAKDKKRQEEAGIKVIEFSPEDRNTFLKKAYKAGWDSVLKVSPESGAQLQKVFNK